MPSSNGKIGSCLTSGSTGPIIVRMSLPRRPSCRSLWRRATALVALLAYINAAVASPLPVLKERHKDRSRTFPCQDRPCGCNNADDFWRSCCCFTVEERLAWAHENAVTPPDFVEPVPPAATETTNPVESPQGSETCCGTGSCSCCNKDKTQPCCSSPAPVKKNSEQTTPQNPKSPAKHPSAKHASAALPGLFALQCQGGSAFALGNGEVLPTFVMPAWQPLLNAAGWLTLFGEIALDRSEPPMSPPPRTSP